MKINGKILEIFETKEIKEGFQKRDFVLEYAENPQYPEYLKFETIQEKCVQLDKLSAGQEVEVMFNLKGRIWTNPQGEKVYFNSLQAWKIEVVGDVTNAEPKGEGTPPDMNDLMSFEESDDLPF
jgi:hypothetical protein